MDPEVLARMRKDMIENVIPKIEADIKRSRIAAAKARFRID